MVPPGSRVGTYELVRGCGISGALAGRSICLRQVVLSARRERTHKLPSELNLELLASVYFDSRVALLGFRRNEK